VDIGVGRPGGVARIGRNMGNGGMGERADQGDAEQSPRRASVARVGLRNGPCLGCDRRACDLGTLGPSRFRRGAGQGQPRSCSGDPLPCRYDVAPRQLVAQRLEPLSTRCTLRVRYDAIDGW
jgi:hypothetical protein